MVVSPHKDSRENQAGITGRLAACVDSVRYEELPEAVVAVAKVITLDGLDCARTWVTLAVALKDGRLFHTRCDCPRGRWDFPLSREERLAKFHDCARRVLQPEQAEQVAAMVETIETVENAKEIMLLLSADSRG